MQKKREKNNSPTTHSSLAGSHVVERLNVVEIVRAHRVKAVFFFFSASGDLFSANTPTARSRKRQHKEQEAKNLRKASGPIRLSGRACYKVVADFSTRAIHHPYELCNKNGVVIQTWASNKQRGFHLSFLLRRTRRRLRASSQPARGRR